MTDIEFEIIDELYFVTSFDELKANVSMEQDELFFHLKQLYNKGWVRCFKNISGEEISGLDDWENQYSNFYFLASKEGLKAHNSL